EAFQDAVPHHDRRVEVGRPALLDDATHQRRANGGKTIKDLFKGRRGEIERVSAEVFRFDKITLQEALRNSNRSTPLELGCRAKASMHARAASMSPRISGVWHAPTRR